MTTDQVKCFIKVVECNSFSKAADELFISTSSVSRKISALEKDINLQLFLRKATGFELTESGKILYDGLKDIDDRIEVLLQKAHKSYSGFEGSVKVAFFINQEICPDVKEALEEFESKYPKIKVEFTADKFDGIFKMLRLRKVDSVISLKYLFDSVQEFQYSTISYVKSCLAVPKKFLKGLNTPISINDLSSIPLIRMRNDIDSYFFEHLKDCGLQPKSKGIFTENEADFALSIERQQGMGFIDSTSRICKSENIVPLTFNELKPFPFAQFWGSTNANPAFAIWRDFLNEKFKNKYCNN